MGISLKCIILKDLSGLSLKNEWVHDFNGSTFGHGRKLPAFDIPDNCVIEI
jgi:hypothetical protein